MSEWMHEWMLLKIQDAHERAGAGAGRLSDHCLVILVSYFWWCFFKFCSVVLEKRRGCWLKKPCRHEDSPVLFCHFFPPFYFPLLSSTSASVKPLLSRWYDTKSFSFSPVAFCLGV